MGTTASPEKVKNEDEKNGDSFSRGRLPFHHSHINSAYWPLAYEPGEPEPKTYADILGRAISEPRWRSGVKALKRVRRALQPGERFRTDDFSVQPAASSLPLDHILGRSLKYVTKQSELLEAVLSAVSRDVSGHLVPEGHTRGPAGIRAHHLGRWYANGRGLKAERRRIEHYLGTVNDTTEKARRIINSTYSTIVLQALADHKAAVKRSILQLRREFETFIHSMACEVRLARQSGQWHKVWTLERKLASTVSMFLPARPLATLSSTFFNSNRNDERMTEISMSRMAAEWNDSYKSLYEDDVYTRKRMDLAKRYWAVFNSPLHEKPWQGEAVIFVAKSPISSGTEYIILRHDQSKPPTSLWPRVWKPVVRDDAEITAGSNPTRAAHKIKLKKIQGPRGAGKKSKRKGETDKVSGGHSQQRPSLGTTVTTEPVWNMSHHDDTANFPHSLSASFSKDFKAEEQTSVSSEKINLDRSDGNA